jgi:glycerophosphoryl diester phosphodiesterase
MFRIGLLVSVVIATCGMDAPSHAADPPRPMVVAHRGLLLDAPENTLANFRACLELRLGFEFDVQRTKDGELVCIHDNTLNRTTNGTGAVAEKTLAEIRNLDAGSWFDPKFTGEKVPTVEDVLKLVAEYRERDILAAVDLKAEGVECDVVRLAEKSKVLHRLVFIGRTISDPQVREQIKQTSPEAQTAVVANTPVEFAKALAAPHADWVYFRFIPSEEQIDAVQSSRKRAFIAGTPVSGRLPDNWQQVIKVGADAILTDYPLELQATVRKMQLKK